LLKFFCKILIVISKFAHNIIRAKFDITIFCSVSSINLDNLRKKSD